MRWTTPFPIVRWCWIGFAAALCPAGGRTGRRYRPVRGRLPRGEGHPRRCGTIASIIRTIIGRAHESHSGLRYRAPAIFASKWKRRPWNIASLCPVTHPSLAATPSDQRIAEQDTLGRSRQRPRAWQEHPKHGRIVQDPNALAEVGICGPGETSSWPTSLPAGPSNGGTEPINRIIELHRRITCGSATPQLPTTDDLGRRTAHPPESPMSHLSVC